MLILKLSNYLFVTESGDIWSYETRVGQIQNGRILEFGKFSRTTTKHMNLVATLTKLPRCTNSDCSNNIHFDKLEMGHRTPGKFSTSQCLSQDLSLELMAGIGKGDFFDFVLKNIGKIKSERDRKLVKEYAMGKGMKSIVFDYFVSLHQALTLETV